MLTPLLKLGKRPATEDLRDLLFKNYADVGAVFPIVPPRFGNGFAYHGDAWGMLGNSRVGDCVFAGGAHEEMMISKVLLGSGIPFTEGSVISDYSAVTGYVEGDRSTDNGTYVRDAYAYRQKVGLLDALGTRHKIGPYVALDPKNWEQLMTAVYVFGAVGIGFDFPESAWDQFANGEKWDVVPGSPIDGGHYVPIVGSMISSSEATCITWARRQILTRAFYEEYNDEAWTYVPGELRADGTGLHHVDVATLEADLRLITG